MTNRTFMTVEEVAAEMGVSKSYAYTIGKSARKFHSNLCAAGFF